MVAVQSSISNQNWGRHRIPTRREVNIWIKWCNLKSIDSLQLIEVLTLRNRLFTKTSRACNLRCLNPIWSTSIHSNNNNLHMHRHLKWIKRISNLKTNTNNYSKIHNSSNSQVRVLIWISIKWRLKSRITSWPIKREEDLQTIKDSQRLREIFKFSRAITLKHVPQCLLKEWAWKFHLGSPLIPRT